MPATAVPFAVAMLKVTGPGIAFDRLTVKENALVPAWPSVNLASLIVSTPLLAPSTAAGTLRMPLPQPCGQATGIVRAVCLMMASMTAGAVSVSDCITATAPATCGAAIEVPLMK